jgi:hypothetical protein
VTNTYTETFTGADNSAPAAVWTVVNATGASSTIQGNRLRQIAGSTASTATTARFNINTAVTDFEFRAASELMTSVDSGFMVAFRGDAYVANRGFPTNGYLLYATSAGSIIYRVDAGGLTGLNTVATLGGTGGTVVSFVLRVVGSHLQAKVWAGGAEPGTWDIDVTDSTYTYGFVGIGTESTPSVSQEIRWDNITIEFLSNGEYVQDIATSTNTNATGPPNTLVGSFTGQMKPAVGDMIVAYGSRDNIVNDPATGDTFSDGSNTYTRVARAQPSGTSTAAAGVVGVMFYSVLTVAWSGTQTLTWTMPTGAADRAMRVEHYQAVSGVRGTPVSVGAAAGATGNVTTTDPVAGDLVLAMAAVEHSSASTVTPDSDTTSGVWQTQTPEVASAGTTLAAVKVVTQRKYVTATASQTYNVTNSVTASVDIVGIVAVFTPATTGGPVALSGNNIVATTVSSNSGQLAVARPLDGTVAATTVSSNTQLAVARPLAGTIAAATTTTGAATGDLFPVAKALAGVINSVDTVTGNIAGPVALVGTIAVATTTTNATQLAVAKALVGNTIAASTATAGTLISALDLIGSIIETTAVTATNLTATQALVGTIAATTTDTGTLTATQALAGTINAATTTTATTIGAAVPLTGAVNVTTATPAAALGTSTPLTGNIAVTTTTTAALGGTRALTGTVAVTTTDTADLGAARALTGTIATTTTTAGTANLFRPLVGTIATTTTTTATTFVGAVALVGNAITVTTTTPAANVGIGLALTDYAAAPADWDSSTTDWDSATTNWDAGLLVPTLNPYTRTAGNLVVTGPTDLIGSVVVTTSTAGNAAVAPALVGNIVVTTAVSVAGQLTVARALTGAINTTTNLTGTRHDIVRALVGTLNATSTVVSGQPTVTWALVAAVNITTGDTGVLTGATGFAASLAATTTLPTAELAVNRALVGTITTTTEYTANAITAQALVGTVATLVAPQTATLDAGRGLTAQVFATNTATGLLGVTQAYNAALAVTTTTAGNVVLGGPGSLDGTTRATTTVTGILVVTRALTGTITTSTTIPAAALPIDRPLTAAVNAALSLGTPPLALDQRLAGTVNAAVLLGAAVLLTGVPQVIRGAVTWDVVEGDIDYDVITQTNAIAEVIYS